MRLWNWFDVSGSARVRAIGSGQKHVVPDLRGGQFAGLDAGNRLNAVGDKATGTHVLTQLYADWKDKPVTVDLEKLWRELGVSLDGDSVRFDDAAPSAAVRKAITESRKR